MNNDTKKKSANQFAEAFAKSLSESLAGATGVQWPLAVMDTAEAAASQGTPVHFRLTVEGAIDGECFAEFYEPQVQDLATRAAQQQGTSTPEDAGDALSALIASALDGFAQQISATAGDVTVNVERVAGLAFGGMFVVPLAATQDQANLQILLYFGAPLLEALSGSEQAGQASETNAASALPKNLKLVMDVELNVTLRFGQRQMPLREVLELGSGSVVELDRMIDEPVELLLDGKLIARGEAVVVDGNYGLRVTEIPQPVTSHFLN
ncbi:MAG TPA: flagellar motor switch protein FliN [Terracidiphilus sp.]|jgi:flagellar motor switch protein FliN/FliY|nr:flagellar motor switch protein FliN [Terracidiphilus sp.]